MRLVVRLGNGPEGRVKMGGLNLFVADAVVGSAYIYFGCAAVRTSRWLFAIWAQQWPPGTLASVVGSRPRVAGGRRWLVLARWDLPGDRWKPPGNQCITRPCGGQTEEERQGDLLPAPGIPPWIPRWDWLVSVSFFLCSIPFSATGLTCSAAAICSMEKPTLRNQRALWTAYWWASSGGHACPYIPPAADSHGSE